MNIQYRTYIMNLEALDNFAKRVADLLSTGDTILLKGNLGVGKTTFTQYLINHLSDKKIEVLSPTFNLVNTYNTKLGEVWHFDLYRLKNKNEIYELSFEDVIENKVCIIEWPNIIQELLPSNYLELVFEQKLDDQREIEIICSGNWQNKWTDNHAKS